MSCPVGMSMRKRRPIFYGKGIVSSSEDDSEDDVRPIRKRARRAVTPDSSSQDSSENAIERLNTDLENVKNKLSQGIKLVQSLEPKVNDLIEDKASITSQLEANMKEKDNRIRELEAQLEKEQAKSNSNENAKRQLDKASNHWKSLAHISGPTITRN